MEHSGDDPMATQGFKRKLTAIFSADVAGYSRLMGEDEAATVKTLDTYRRVISDLIQQHRGRVVDSPGDNILAEFASVVDAVQCAVAVQKEIQSRNLELPETRRMQFRIGINLGDVIEEEDRLYGDGVNIAARLESLAEPGGICVSKTAFDHIETKLPLGYEYLGEQTVKNIAKPVPAYKVLMEPRVTIKAKKKPEGARRRGKFIALVSFLLMAAGAAVFWRFAFPLAEPKVEKASKEKMAFPLPNKPSIAVLPFVNMSDDAKQEYFSDGMTEDLITDLSKLSGLLVIARNSTFTYKGKPVKIKQVAEELGVRYVLEGSVRKAGDEVRINAQLIDAMTGHHLWAERYDGKMDMIFALQDQITKKIVSALEVKLTGGEKELGGQRGTDNVAAYDEFLRGWGHYLRLTPQDFVKAVTSFKKAIELDPNYGRAYAALALVCWTGTADLALLQGLGMSWEEARLRSREYVKEALKQPTSIAYNVSSQMYLYRRQHKEAISELERALSLDPNDPSCHQSMGFALSMAGRPREAIEYINRGMRLDPQNPSRYLALLGMAHFCLGELAEATALSEEALRLNPENVGIGVQLAAFYGLLGRNQEARATLETVGKKLFIAVRLHVIMFGYPFRDRAVADRYLDGLLKAGVTVQPPGYLPAFQENQSTGEEIRALLFGSRITATAYPGRAGLRSEIDFKKNGEFTWRGASSSDIGKSRIEGDLICTQYQKNWWGLEDCATVFRNPSGTPEGRDEYFFVSDIGFLTFSPVR
jgi:TolB-like protein/class 3 adenylate cyclase/Flp pilus assembly protein TadD